MLYHCTELVRNVPTGSELGYEDSVHINISLPLDKQYAHHSFVPTGDECIPLGHMIASADGGDLKLSMWKAYGYTSHSITGNVFYEILFYRAMDGGFIPFKLKIRSKVYQRPVEMVHYENLGLIYGEYVGGYTHVVDPRMELLGTFVTDGVVADCSGLVDRTTDVLDKHPMFGKCAYNTFSVSRMRQSLVNLANPLTNPFGFGQKHGSPLQLVDTILPMEIPWNAAHEFMSFPRDPKSWIFVASPIILPQAAPLTPTSHSLQINPKSCQGVADVFSELKGTDFDITFTTDTGSLYSTAHVDRYVNSYAVVLNSPNTASEDVLELQHSALFTIIQAVRDYALYSNNGILERLHAPHGRIQIRIQLTNLDESLISISDTAGLFHQIYIDLAALSLCSLGTSVAYSDVPAIGRSKLRRQITDKF